MNDRLLALSCLSALKILSLKKIAFERFLHATPVFLYLIAHPATSSHYQQRFVSASMASGKADFAEF